MHSIIVYSTPTCPYCRQAEAYLREHGFEFKEINVAADSLAAEEMIRKTGQMGVPVIEVDGEIIVGFDRTKLAELLKIKE